MTARAQTLREQGEDGQIMVLVLGFATVVLALAFVVASVAALHIERKQLLAATDAAALAAAAAIDWDGFYAAGASEVVLTDESVRAAVTEYLSGSAGSIGLEDVRIEEPTGSTDARSVIVTLSSRARLPLVPWLTDGVPDVLRVEVSSSARAG